MKKFHSRLKDTGYLLYRWLHPLLDPLRLPSAVPGYPRFFKDWMRYSKMPGAEKTRLVDSAPCLGDRTQTTEVDRHYFYQNIWAFQKVFRIKPTSHVDVGSQTEFVGFLSILTRVTFVDLRPLSVPLDHLESRRGDILNLPFEDRSVSSLSCLHVAEHIGLGRYGDSLDPQGTRKACHELARILAPRGHLYFSLPVGRPRLCFNAHRIHSPRTILDYFSGLDLLELSGIDDAGGFIKNVDLANLEKSDYGCGLFHFQKP